MVTPEDVAAALSGAKHLFLQYGKNIMVEQTACGLEVPAPQTLLAAEWQYLTMSRRCPACVANMHRHGMWMTTRGARSG